MKSKIIVILFAFIGGVIVNQIATYTQSQEPNHPQTEWHSLSFKHLYTYINLTIEADSVTMKSISDSLNKTFTTFQDEVQSSSELDSIIYNAVVGDEIKLTPTMYELFSYGAQKFQKTHGAINIGIGNLLRAYGLLYNMTPRLPSESEIAHHVSSMKTPFFELVPEIQSIRILRSGEHYAVGSYSKGKALDLAVAIFNHHSIKNYLLEVGGDIVYAGISKKLRPWRIGVRDPKRNDGMLGILSLSLPRMTSMATSGGYEKYFTDAQGKKHHHILSAQTGRSIEDKKSVTALSIGGMDTDFWATYLFVLPVDSAMKVVALTKDLEAIIVDNNDSTRLSDGVVEVFVPQQ